MFPIGQDGARRTRPLGPWGLLIMALGGGALAWGGGCGGSGRGLTTDSVTRCPDAACPTPRPGSPSMMCPDGSIAGPACIQREGTCGWAIVTCPLGRGASENGGMTAIAGRTGVAGASVGASGGVASGGSSSGGTGGNAGPIVPQGTGGNGTFSWTGNSQTFSGTGYYEHGPSTTGQSFVITIASGADVSEGACTLRGQFPAVPPSAGFYPMADVAMPLADGTFVAHCSSSSPFDSEDGSVSGQVAISVSLPGQVEGSFNMQAARHIPGTGGSIGLVSYSGSFAVGCRDRRPATDPACGARSIEP